MDRDQDATQAGPPEAAASGESPREPESGVMNRLFRTVGGWLTGPDEEASGEQPEQQGTAEQAEAAEPPETVTLSRAELEARERAWQAQKDREVAQTRTQLERQHALDRAEQGDVGPIRAMAERGDRWAREQLAAQGETWALGEIAQKELQEQQSGEAEMARATGYAAHFDQAYLEPLLAALPDPTAADAIRSETVGMEGRARAVGTVLKALEAHHRRAGAEAALSDAGFVEKLLRSESFRAALVKSPVANKQFRAFFAGDLGDPEAVAGLPDGGRGGGEHAHMNALFRDAYFGALERGEDERAAGAGAPNGRMAHRDLVADDEA